MPVDEDRRPAQADPATGTDRLAAFASSSAVEHSFLRPEHHESNDHVAFLYTSRTEQFGVVIPYIQQGLQRNERCLYVADENSRTEVVEAFQSCGIDVDAALESGALTIQTKDGTYLKDGSFSPEDMVGFLEDAVADAVEEYDGLRTTAEMTWVLGDRTATEALVEYERQLNRHYPGLDIIGLCQYNRARFPPEIINDVIRTHPHLVHDNSVVHNVYYTPRERHQESAAPSHEVDHWTSVLSALAKAETDLAAKNERLEEFASIVSHDLRNPLSVAQGNLELAREEYDSDHLDTVDDALTRSQALIDDLLTLARDGDEVSSVDPVELGALTENCWQNVATAEASIVTKTGRRVRADRSRLQRLFENLYRNAIEHGRDDVTVTVGELDAGFYLEDDGPGIPEAIRDDVFEAGYSTSEHGTGFGLSIVEQVAEAHGWNVELTEGSGGGARFEITGVEFSAE